ncbi:MAG TPA: hypothetical protein VF342_15060 [Alphaproteobacteria bacterium]
MTDGGEGFFLVLWVIVGFVVLGAAIAYFSWRNRIEQRRKSPAERTREDEKRRAAIRNEYR